MKFEKALELIGKLTAELDKEKVPWAITAGPFEGEKGLQSFWGINGEETVVGGLLRGLSTRFDTHVCKKVFQEMEAAKVGKPKKKSWWKRNLPSV